MTRQNDQHMAGERYEALVPDTLVSVYPHSNQWFDRNPRSLWSLALLRVITGSGYGLDIEERMKASVVSRVTEGRSCRARRQATDP